jgi:hypothetical protein
MINVNFLTNIEQDDAIPDLRISIQNVRDRQLTLIIPAIGESAFSQHLTPLYFKLKTAVAANPALLMVIVAVVQELRPYFSPERHSTAYNVLLNEPRRSWDDFHLSADGGDPALDRPIVVEGHTWASLKSVRFKVWLRGAQAIDIDSVDPNLVADGVMFLLLPICTLFILSQVSLSHRQRYYHSAVNGQHGSRSHQGAAHRALPQHGTCDEPCPPPGSQYQVPFGDR